MALALYLDAVLPDANGVRLPPWFFLMPGYWGRGASVSRVSWDFGGVGWGLCICVFVHVNRGRWGGFYPS
jgi:hypothetical protein